MGLAAFVTSFVAPVFLMVSPITSYADQIYSIHKTKSSAGFSLDIPLIMLAASMLRVFYYPGAKFDTSLLIQSFIMITMQTLLLRVALDNRPSPASKGGEAAIPFSGVNRGDTGSRPYNFWQWRSPKPYWQFLIYMFITLTVLELIISPSPPLYAWYSTSIGYLGLSIEATLPLPQIWQNMQQRAVKGFRLSVLVNWIAGDMMKMFWFFTATSEIPWAFKLCGIFQMCCDLFLGLQYWVYGEGEVVQHGYSGKTNGIPLGEKDLRLG